MTLKSTWVTGETYAATDQNAIAAAVNSNTTALSSLFSSAASASVASSQTTGSTTYADLVTTTDQVTVTVGASGVALVVLNVQPANNSGGNVSYTSFALSGANTQAATDNYSLGLAYPSSFVGWPSSGTFVLTGLTPGSTTFKMKYRVTGGTGTFSNRVIAVIPFP